MASKTKLIVNYLPQSIADKDLIEMFSPFGEIDSVRVIRDSKTGYSYGYGFVNYKNEDSGPKAIYQMNGLEIQAKKIKVAFSRETGDKDTNLYITNLPRAITVDDLDRIFSVYGNIVQRSVLIDKFTQMPRGVAFVRYSRAEEANAAIAAMNGQVLDSNSSEPLQIKVADDHSKQKAAYYMGLQHGQKMVGRFRGRGQNFGPMPPMGRGLPMGRGQLMGRGQPMGRGQQMGRGLQMGRGRFQTPPYPMKNPAQFPYF